MLVKTIKNKYDIADFQLQQFCQNIHNPYLYLKNKKKL